MGTISAMRRLLATAVLISLNLGCAATPVPVAIVDAKSFDAAAKRRQVVLACTIVHHEIQANYGFGEQIPFAAARPRRGFLSRVTCRVDGVVRGRFDAQEVVVAHAQAAVEGEAEKGLAPFAPGDGRQVWLAFDVGWLRGRHDYVLAPRGH